MLVKSLWSLVQKIIIKTNISFISYQNVLMLQNTAKCFFTDSFLQHMWYVFCKKCLPIDQDSKITSLGVLK